MRSTLAQVWAALVDIDDASLREEAIDAVDDACEIMVADWPEDFEITDEVSAKVQQQIDLEVQLNKLVKEAEGKYRLQAQYFFYSAKALRDFSSREIGCSGRMAR